MRTTSKLVSRGSLYPRRYSWLVHVFAVLSLRATQLLVPDQPTSLLEAEAGAGGGEGDAMQVLSVPYRAQKGDALTRLA